MRTLSIAGTAAAALLCAATASAGQRVVQRGPGPAPMPASGGWNAPRPMPQAGNAPRPMPQAAGWNGRGPRPGQPAGGRWGSKVNGRWWGGANAPGGWNAYRRPTRGWALPTYWNTPRFYVSDWQGYGLSQPAYGYNWVRYYDDAVLVDRRGSIYDSVGDVDWDRYDAGQDGYADDRGYERRDDGVSGALAGAAAGGVVGALIGGRDNRLGGALIGAGVGGVAGYAIDKAEDRGRRAPPPPPAPHGYDGYGASYPQPGRAPGYAPPPAPRPVPVAPSNRWVSPDGTTTVVTTAGYGYGGGTTTVTVQSAPVVTTTTTEIYEDNVTWSRPPKKKAWKPKRRTVCYCR